MGCQVRLGGVLFSFLFFLSLSPHKTCQNKEGDWGFYSKMCMELGLRKLVISECIVLSLLWKELLEVE